LTHPQTNPSGAGNLGTSDPTRTGESTFWRVGFCAFFGVTGVKPGKTMMPEKKNLPEFGDA